MTRKDLPQTELAPHAARRVRYIHRVDRIPRIPEHERAQLRKVAGVYAFRANDYYLGLIDWDDPNDPIRRLIIPRVEELNDWGRLDASNEAAVTVAPGVQHKYEETVLLLCNEICGAYCRYCFRKRLFMNGNAEVTKDVSAGIRYIAEHPKVTNVLLTGGDPLIMSTRRLREIISRLRAIPHVRIIRIGSKIPAFNPFRILNDIELQDLLRTHSTPERRIYLMAHFDHPRELTTEAAASLAKYIECGVICVNQCPLIKGINDDPDVLSDLYRKLSWMGCTPYYLFQGRPTAGNEPYEVPLVRGWQIFQEALTRGSGLARRPRFVMSHESGKVEILGVDERHIYLRYHRAKRPENRGQLVIMQRDDSAYWLDQLKPAADSYIPLGVKFHRFNGDSRRRGNVHVRRRSDPRRQGRRAGYRPMPECNTNCSRDGG